MYTFPKPNVLKQQALVRGHFCSVHPDFCGSLGYGPEQVRLDGLAVFICRSYISNSWSRRLLRASKTSKGFGETSTSAANSSF